MDGESETNTKHTNQSARYRKQYGTWWALIPVGHGLSWKVPQRVWFRVVASGCICIKRPWHGVVAVPEQAGRVAAHCSWDTDTSRHWPMDVRSISVYIDRETDADMFVFR